MSHLAVILFGCALLFFGAEWLVRGSTIVAVRLKIPKAVAGLTLVALGTSAPELFVNLLSASRGHTGFAMSNIAGSNLANLCIGFGICGLVGTISVPFSTFRSDLAFFLGSPIVVVVGLLVAPRNQLDFPSSTFLLTALLIAYFLTLVFRAREQTEEPTDAVAGESLTRGLLQLVLGSVFLYGGAETVLAMSIGFARAMGMSEAVIGLTIVAAGTSIPDITASVVATMKNENDIAVGNILGSNVSNIVFVLNGTLLTAGTSLRTDFLGTMDFIAVLVASMLFALKLGFQRSVTKTSGGCLIAAYLMFLCWRIVQVT